jgi:predicted metal-dependent HD superfamily phosphohydrolase
VESVRQEALTDRWRRLGARAGFRSCADAWLERLIAAWTEPHRHYHNLEHVEECLSRLDEVPQLCENATALELAIWFHDAVYDPKAPDNEECSADLARQCLAEVGCGAELQDKIATLILATKTHEPGGSHDTAVLLDIDLSILGSRHERFARYEDNVRREFAWVPEELFAEKRAAILEMFLARTRIYQTDVFSERFEAQARDNLRWTIARLRAGLVSR